MNFLYIRHQLRFHKGNSSGEAVTKRFSAVVVVTRCARGPCAKSNCYPEARPWPPAFFLELCPSFDTLSRTSIYGRETSTPR